MNIMTEQIVKCKGYKSACRVSGSGGGESTVCNLQPTVTIRLAGSART